MFYTSIFQGLLVTDPRFNNEAVKYDQKEFLVYVREMTGMINNLKYRFMRILQPIPNTNSIKKKRRENIRKRHAFCNWGLDYPPLTAYHSYVNAYIASKINSSSVDLKISHGFESERHKTFLRSTVLAAYTLIFLPACILVASFIDKVFKQNIFLQLRVLFITYPGLIDR
uniref:Alpha-1,3-glucosyltransferase n=1 Tax=Glossina palpalis gambiensis TaxID=67801 RepID=A0A1B0C7U2_9MUSC